MGNNEGGYANTELYVRNDAGVERIDRLGHAQARCSRQLGEQGAAHADRAYGRHCGRLPSAPLRRSASELGTDCKRCRPASQQCYGDSTARFGSVLGYYAREH